MNNENEKIIKLLSGINAAQNEMISAVSHRTGHTAEETAVLLLSLIHISAPTRRTPNS